jgi:hypothetical protein
MVIWRSVSPLAAPDRQIHRAPDPDHRSPNHRPPIRLAVRPLLFVLGLRGGAMADNKNDKNQYDQDYLDKNTEIRRDTEIRDALGEPELHEDERIQKDDLLTDEEARKEKPEHREK